MPHILINSRLPPETAERLQAIPDVNVSFSDRGLKEHHAAVEFPADEIRDVDILLCTTPPKNFSDMRALKFIQLAAVGFGQLDEFDIVSRGIRVANARGVYDTSIGEWNLAMMISLGRDLRQMIRNQEQGFWEKSARFAHEIRGSVVGLWGYGGIGRETARLAKTLGMTVHVYARRGVGPRTDTYVAAGTGDPDGKLPDRVFVKGQELEFLSGLDFLILAMPLTPESTGLIGERELRAQTDCVSAEPGPRPIDSGGRIGEGAAGKLDRWSGIDTHYYYPMPADHPLWRFPNVIMTPHISGSDLGPLFVSRMSDILVHNVRQFLAEKPLWNELTAEELAGKDG